jgi:hypothetical protein
VAHARGRRLARVAAAPAVPPDAVSELPLPVLRREEQGAVSDEPAGVALPDAPAGALDPLPDLLLAVCRVDAFVFARSSARAGRSLSCRVAGQGGVQPAGRLGSRSIGGHRITGEIWRQGQDRRRKPGAPGRTRTPNSNAACWTGTWRSGEFTNSPRSRVAVLTGQHRTMLYRDISRSVATVRRGRAISTTRRPASPRPPREDKA